MEAGDWITLAAVIIALGIGVASILHTQSLQRKERRERLLNEITEWAVDVLRCEPEVSTPFQAGVKDERSILPVINVDLLTKYRKAAARSEYIRQVALNFEKDLQSAAKKAFDELSNTIEFLSRHATKATVQEVGNYRLRLVLSTKALIKKVAKLKTQGIS